jgi:phosphoribosylglycinamide formyltransferase-1
MKKIIIFASGSGSNAENIFHKLNNKLDIQAIFCNNAKAGVIERAQRLNIPLVLFDKSDWNSNSVLNKLISYGPDLIVLAGFLWKVPESLVQQFPNKIINIHPSLLPKFGGKGMYGHHVHDAVIAANEPKSGITIHFVNEHYDEGTYIFQAECELNDADNAQTLAQKIHLLEFEHFPTIIENLLNAE